MAGKRKYKRRKKVTNLKVNPELSGFDIRINSFGEIQSNYEIDQINTFLNKNLEDKKLHSGKNEEERPVTNDQRSTDGARDNKSREDQKGGKGKEKQMKKNSKSGKKNKKDREK